MNRTALFTALLWAFTLAPQYALSQQYTKDGNLNLPKDYRQWVFLSSGIGMTYNAEAVANANPSFENVFVNPEAYRAFVKTGTWPDKTVLVLEIRKSESRVSINKDGRVQTAIAAIEVHLKDSSKGGWAFYGFPGGAATGKPFPKTADCFSCHQQNGATDTTFVQFYPTLVDVARQHGNYKDAEASHAAAH
jgi:Cytochrome P460